MSAQTIHKSQKVSKADVVFNIILYGICGLILLLIAYGYHSKQNSKGEE